MRNFRLWILFSVTVTATFIAGFFMTGLLFWAGRQFDQFVFLDALPVLPLIGFAVSAAIICLFLTLTLSRFFFIPIHELILALNQVSNGNFQVQLSENSKWTDIREMNLHFNKMVRELNSLELLQTDFIQNVSHEIKTPLTSIEGYASLLLKSSLTDEQREYILRISDNSQKLAVMTGNILKLSKLENQQIVPEKRLFSLDEQLRECILSMEPLWNEKNLNLDLELPEIQYLGNEQLLSPVWSNLLSNAIKFTPPEGTVSISIKETADSIQVTVSDTGIGMNEEIIRHIFDKFYQGDESHSGNGNGLGLALVKKTLDFLQGEIQVDSHPGIGSCFTVCLPKDKENL